jgi:hypothetical protein
VDVLGVIGFGGVDLYGSFSKSVIPCKSSLPAEVVVADDRSYIADLVWLATSSAVDLVLSMVLSLELWWARRKLAAKGGMMAKVTWQLLVRFSRMEWTRLIH